MAEESRPALPTTDGAEIARLEGLSRQAWPALEVDVDEIEGWLLGTSGAYTRRLYDRLGFIERYRYWYREEPETRG